MECGSVSRQAQMPWNRIFSVAGVRTNDMGENERKTKRMGEMFLNEAQLV